MTQVQHVRRYRTNPVELGIFLAIITVFAHSIYTLFYKYPTFHPNALKVMASNPISEGRSPASVSPWLLTLDLPCDGAVEQPTQASKVRLSGTFCTAGVTAANQAPSQSRVKNQSNQYSATIFTDNSKGRFTSDYIPLVTGANSIHIEFDYSDGRTFSKDISIIRN